MGCLAMGLEEANKVIDRLIKENTTSEEQDARFRQVFPTDLTSKQCLRNFDYWSKTAIGGKGGLAADITAKNTVSKENYKRFAEL